MLVSPNVHILMLKQSSHTLPCDISNHVILDDMWICCGLFSFRIQLAISWLIMDFQKWFKTLSLMAVEGLLFHDLILPSTPKTGFSVSHLTSRSTIDKLYSRISSMFYLAMFYLAMRSMAVQECPRTPWSGSTSVSSDLLENYEWKVVSAMFVWG